MCLFMRECNAAVISGMKIANRIPTVHSEPYRHLIICRYFWEYQIMRPNYLAMNEIVRSSLPQGPRGQHVEHMICKSCIFIREWIQFQSTLNIISKHFQLVLECPTPVWGGCHAVKTEFEFRALTCINKPCWLRCGIIEQLPLAKFQQGAPQKLSRAFSPCPSYL